jgi:bifunctional ADP-heptose synthase (sugar kinase/adenylyltransferase)
MISRQRLESLVEQFPKLTIGLVGDLFLDRYLDIEPGVGERSVETGLDAHQIPTVRNSPGALGTVMNNLAALGVGRLVPVTVIGDDGHGYDLLHEIRKLPVDDSHVIQDRDRLTPTYTKPMKQDSSGAWRELNRLDIRSREQLSAAANRSFAEHLRKVFTLCDGLIVLDQVNETNWGVVNGEARGLLRELAQGSPDKLMFVDSRAHLGEFDFGVLKGNRSELLAAVGEAAGAELLVENAATLLAAKTGRHVYATIGEAGIMVASCGSLSVSPGLGVEGPIDIVGAGDSATSGIVASLLSGSSPLEAADVGNLVASITVQQLGTTATASPDQVLARCEKVIL